MAVLKNLFGILKSFFGAENKATRNEITKWDYIDILMALAPVTVFGCLLFGVNAVIVLAVSVVLSAGLDFLWDLLFKKEKNSINLSAIVSGLLLGLSLSSNLNILIVILLNIVAVFLRKTFFKGNTFSITTPLLLVRVIFAFIFIKAFSVYALPFISGENGILPIDKMFIT